MSGWDDDEWGSAPAAPVKKESVPVKAESAVSSGWDDDGWGSSGTTATSASKSSSVDDGWGSSSAGDGWGSGSGTSNNNRSSSTSSWGGNRPSISAQSMNKGWSVSGPKRDSDNRSQDTPSMNGTKNHSSRLTIPGQIFVDKLSIDATVTDLRSTFGRFGKITRITIDYKFEDDRAFAWLSFENELSVEVGKSATFFNLSNRH